MNLYQLLREELKDLDLTEFEKLRYIYIRCCQIFSFDSRWFYANFSQDKELKKKIQDKKLDLYNINDPRVVCHSISREVFYKIIPEFTKYHVKLVDGLHSYVIASDDKDEWILDATPDDLARVKLGIETVGFNCRKRFSELNTNSADLKLGFILKDEEYFNSKLTIKDINKRMEKLNLLLQKSACKNYYSDARYFYKTYTLISWQSFDTYVDFNNDDAYFHLLAHYSQDNKFYDMSKPNKTYEIKEIAEEEYKELTRTLKRI